MRRSTTRTGNGAPLRQLTTALKETQAAGDRIKTAIASMKAERARPATTRRKRETRRGREPQRRAA